MQQAKEVKDASEFHDEKATMRRCPGQEEIVAGSVEHIHELKSYTTATMYAPDVNVVVADDEGEGEGEGGGSAPSAAPVNTMVPELSQPGANLSCTMGIWEGAPTSYKYEFFLDGTSAGAAGPVNTYTVQAADADKEATCVVEATNAIGSTKAPGSNPVVVTVAARGGGHTPSRDPAPPKSGPASDRADSSKPKDK